MDKILTIAWKDLYTSLRDRNLILIMFLTPIVLSTIMGLAFGGLSGNGSSAFTEIPLAVVNLDEGFNLAEQIAMGGADSFTGTAPSISDIELEIGGQTINLGEQLQLNANLSLTDTDLSAANASFNFGDILASILLAETDVATNTAVTTGTVSTGTLAMGNFNLGDLTCPLIEEEETNGTEGSGGFTGSLDDLFAAVAVADADAARAGVDRGEFAAAVIIPAGFTGSLIPSFDYFDTEDGEEAVPLTDESESSERTVEVYANAGQSISASIVRAVVEGITNQFVRVSVALDSMFASAVGLLLANFNLNTLGDLDLDAIDPALVTGGLQSLDASILEPLGCLLVPGAGAVRLAQQPLDQLQTRSTFAYLMIILGSSQAIFFSLFTGIFGINSIYSEQKIWTLQRLMASPTPRIFILAGKLIGNLCVVIAQLVVLLVSFTVITSFVERQPTFIWGTNIAALMAVVLAIATFVSGLGALVVGLAKTSEQVQFIGPMVSITFGALGGSFGFRLPPVIAAISPVWLGSTSLEHLSNGNYEELARPLLTLFAIGLTTFLLGSYFFKRRLDL